MHQQLSYTTLITLKRMLISTRISNLLCPTNNLRYFLCAHFVFSLVHWHDPQPLVSVCKRACFFAAFFEPSNLVGRVKQHVTCGGVLFYFYLSPTPLLRHLLPYLLSFLLYFLSSGEMILSRMHRWPVQLPSTPSAIATSPHTTPKQQHLYLFLFFLDKRPHKHTHTVCETHVRVRSR